MLKWRLLPEFARVALDALPDVLSMENVPRLLQFQGGRLFQGFLRSLETAGYSVWHDIIDCAAYGVPQTRRRLVVLASRLGPISLVGPSHTPSSHQTVRHAIGHLPPITAGQQHRTDPLHRASAPVASEPRTNPGHPTWPLLDQLARHTSGTLPSSIVRPLVPQRIWPHVLGPARPRHSPHSALASETAATVIPEQDRAISIREAALLQSMPPTYGFFPPRRRLVHHPRCPLDRECRARSALRGHRSQRQTGNSARNTLCNPPYEMTVDLNVLNHLGINLYSNSPAVLAEAVANAWDADAEIVRIEIHTDPDRIVILDDGHGMSRIDINEKFLRVGHRRRGTRAHQRISTIDQ